MIILFIDREVTNYMEKVIKRNKLTEHISYYISDNTIYLFQDEYNFTKEDIKLLSKRLSLIIEENDISYINITASEIEKKKDLYRDLGFTLSYYDVNKLNLLFKGRKDKTKYRCYGIMTKSDFLNELMEDKKVEDKKNEDNTKVVNSNSGFVSSMILLFGGIILLCYLCVEGAIYLVKQKGDIMLVSDLLVILQKIIDISLVWMMVYFILKNIKNNVKIILLFKGVLVILVIKILSDTLNLTTIGLLLEYVIMWGPLALIIIFQPEIRSILEHIGRKQLLGRHKVLTLDEREKLVYEIMSAVDYLRKSRIGALIVVERDISLNEYIERSKPIYGDISSELLISIFFPRNPLHDGGVIIQGNKITSAGAVFPISINSKISKKLGTRHRAAIGISEESDAIAIVVSEETGKISIAVDGNLNYNLSLDDARMILVEELKPKREVLLDDEFVDEKEDDNDEEA